MPLLGRSELARLSGGYARHWHSDPHLHYDGAVGGPLFTGYENTVGIPLKMGCEVFSREWGPDGRPICIPGPFERIREQLRMQAPLVEKVICYQYQGIMNRRTERVPIGAPGTQELYDVYAAYLGEWRAAPESEERRRGAPHNG